MNDGYRVRLSIRRFANGPAPVFEVTTPGGLTFTAETAWGARRIIRKDKKARKIEKEANREQRDSEPRVAQGSAEGLERIAVQRQQQVAAPDQRQ